MTRRHTGYINNDKAYQQLAAVARELLDQGDQTGLDDELKKA